MGQSRVAAWKRKDECLFPLEDDEILLAVFAAAAAAMVTRFFVLLARKT